MKTLNDISSKNLSRERKAKNDKQLYSLLILITVFVFISLATLSAIGLITYKNISQKAEVIDSIDLGENNDLNIVSDELKDIYKDTSTVRPQNNVDVNSNTPNSLPTQESLPECYNYKIEIEGLESENCYKIDTFTNLVGVINDYNNTLYDIEAAQKSIDATCNNEYFADECESSKNKLAAAQLQKTAKYNAIKEIVTSVN